MVTQGGLPHRTETAEQAVCALFGCFDFCRGFLFKFPSGFSMQISVEVFRPTFIGIFHEKFTLLFRTAFLGILRPIFRRSHSPFFGENQRSRQSKTLAPTPTADKTPPASQ